MRIETVVSAICFMNYLLLHKKPSVARFLLLFDASSEFLRLNQTSDPHFELLQLFSTATTTRFTFYGPLYAIRFGHRSTTTMNGHSNEWLECLQNWEKIETGHDYHFHWAAKPPADLWIDVCLFRLSISPPPGHNHRKYISWSGGAAWTWRCIGKRKYPYERSSIDRALILRASGERKRDDRIRVRHTWAYYTRSNSLLQCRRHHCRCCCGASQSPLTNQLYILFRVHCTRQWCRDFYALAYERLFAVVTDLLTWLETRCAACPLTITTIRLVDVTGCKGSHLLWANGLRWPARQSQ